MPAIFIKPEWWDWAMFIIVPVLLVILVVAVWAIFSGLMGVLRLREEGELDQRRIPDIMGFLKQRRIRRSTLLSYEHTRRPLIRR
jgi:hypothetical protein